MTDRHSTPQPPYTGQPPEPERMTRERAIELLKTDVKSWNKWRKENFGVELPDLGSANQMKKCLRISKTRLNTAGFCHSKAAFMLQSPFFSIQEKWGYSFMLNKAPAIKVRVFGADFFDLFPKRKSILWANIGSRKISTFINERGCEGKIEPSQYFCFLRPFIEAIDNTLAGPISFVFRQIKLRGLISGSAPGNS